MNTIRSDRPQTLRFAPAVTLGLAAVVLTSFAVIALGARAGRRFRRRGGHTAAERRSNRRPVTPTSSPAADGRAVGRALTGSDRGALGRRQRRDADPGRPHHRDRRRRLRRHRRCTGLLVEAASGTPGDGASVEAYTVNVENLDPTTLRLSWVDFPIDNALALYIDRSEDGYRFVLVQPDPTGPTDAMGFDRELVLTFAQPISASQVETFLQGGLDTPG